MLAGLHADKDQPHTAGKDVDPLEQANRVREKLNEIYKGWGLTWLPPIGFNNKHELIMLQETAHKFRIQSISDLVHKSEGLTFAAPTEYFIRESTFPRLERLAEKAETPLRFRDVREVDIQDRFSGLLAGEYDVGVAFTTDPQMEDPRLQKIDWDAHFPEITQWAMPLCRSDVLMYYPIQDALSQLSINEAGMRKLIRKAEREGNTPFAIKGVAAESEVCRKLR
jgi:osmoprotectant transport system permease protein